MADHTRGNVMADVRVKISTVEVNGELATKISVGEAREVRGPTVQLQAKRKGDVITLLERITG